MMGTMAVTSFTWYRDGMSGVVLMMTPTCSVSATSFATDVKRDQTHQY